MSPTAKVIWCILAVGFTVFCFRSYRSVRNESTSLVARVSEHFEPHWVERARYYRRQGMWVMWLREAAEILVLLLLAWPKVNRVVFGVFEGWSGGRPWLSAALGATAVLMIVNLIALPFQFFRGYLMEHAYGFSRQTPGEWFRDVAKIWMVELVVGLPVCVALLGVMRRYPESWWIGAGCVLTVVIFGMIYLAPKVIDPLFFNFKRLEDREWESRMIDMARGAGLSVDKVWVADAGRRSTKKNAYFTGLGPTKRIVLYDTLLEGSIKPEIESVVAHELGHWRYRHTLLGAGAAVFAVFLLGYLLSGLYPVLPAPALGAAASIPHWLLLITLAGIIAAPVENTFSRWMEKAADRYSLALTGKGEVFVDMEIELARTNLSDPLPEPWVEWMYHSHPAAIKRIALAEGVAAAK